MLTINILCFEVPNAFSQPRWVKPTTKNSNFRIYFHLEESNCIDPYDILVILQRGHLFLPTSKLKLIPWKWYPLMAQPSGCVLGLPRWFTLVWHGTQAISLVESWPGSDWQYILAKDVPYVVWYRALAWWQYGCQWGVRHGLQLAGITLLWLVGVNMYWDCLVSQCIVGSRDWCELPLFYKGHWYPLPQPWRQALGLHKETVKGST